MHESIVMLVNIYGLSLLFRYLGAPWPLVTAFVLVWVLFLNVNPYDTDQDKYTILKNLPQKYTLLDPDEYPMVVKPRVCTRNGSGVKVLRQPEDNPHSEGTMTQGFVTFKDEVGILYENGQIVSMVQKNSDDPEIMSGCLGKNTCTNVDVPWKHKILELSAMIPNFYVGRYDIKYQGDEFYVLEVNGTMGFDLQKNTRQNPLYYMERWFLVRLLTGLSNMIHLRGYNPIDLVRVMAITLYNTFRCLDWEKLFTLYS